MNENKSFTCHTKSQYFISFLKALGPLKYSMHTITLPVGMGLPSPSENKSVSIRYPLGVFQTCSVSGYRSVYLHFQDPLKSLYIRDHRAVAQRDTSLTGSDHQIASVAVIHSSSRVDSSLQIECFPGRQRCHSFLFSLCGKTRQINLYLIQLLNLLVPLSLKRGY